MINPQLMPRLRDSFDGLVLAAAHANDFYRMALEIEPNISPAEINDEVWAAYGRWKRHANADA
ncbi:MAG: hypothetical protein AB1440_05540 [Pseudomonadota bacterium]|jgi:hypothetical protein